MCVCVSVCVCVCVCVCVWRVCANSAAKSRGWNHWFQRPATACLPAFLLPPADRQFHPLPFVTEIPSLQYTFPLLADHGVFLWNSAFSRSPPAGPCVSPSSMLPAPGVRFTASIIADVHLEGRQQQTIITAVYTVDIYRGPGTQDLHAVSVSVASA